LTFLLFLKMADEQSQPPFNKPSPAPKKFAWPTLLKLDGEALEAHYRKLLQELGSRGGMLSKAHRRAQRKTRNPAGFEDAQAGLSSVPALA
jgi:type I restriction enzyme M protein